MSERAASRGVVVGAVLLSALVDAALLGRVSEDGAGATVPVGWWVGGQAAVGGLAVVGWLTLLAARAPALGDWSLPWTHGGEQLRVPMSWPRPEWSWWRVSLLYLAGTGLGVAAAVALDGLDAATGVAAWLGLPVLQAFAGLLGFLVALLLAVPVVMLVRTWRPHGGRRPVRSTATIATLLISAYLLILPFSTAAALVYDVPDRRRPSLAPVWGDLGGAVVHSETLLWAARVLGAAMLGLALGAAALIVARRRRP